MPRSTAQPTPRGAYRVLVGVDYGGVRHEPGEVVADIPPGMVAVWLAEHVIEEAS